MLNTMKRESFFGPPETHYFSPEDLARMRYVYHAACMERPRAAHTQVQRSNLAKAIVEVFDASLSEVAILAAAWNLIK